MTTFSTTHDITTLGAQFIPSIEGDLTFRNDGVIYGHNGPWYWAVMDPLRHPLFVWARTGTANYDASAKALGAVSFSNGCMMGKYTPAKMVSLFVTSVVLSAVIAGMVGGFWGGLVGAVAAGITAYFLLTRDWKPLGPVYGRHNGIDDRGVSNPDPWLAVMGRKSRDPLEQTPISDYVMRMGTNDSGLDEASGGMIPLIQNSAVFSATVGTANYNPAFADITKPTISGIVAWGWIYPPVGEGELIAIGSDRTGVSAALPGILASIGVRDAAAMDGNNSVLLGEHAEAWFEPGDMKERIEHYGFYCGTHK